MTAWRDAPKIIGTEDYRRELGLSERALGLEGDIVRAHVAGVRFMTFIQEVAKDTGTVLAEQRTDLAFERTIIASERTLMAWIRTALSMIGFGFTIFKFFQYLPEDIASGNIKRPQAPRNLGLSLIGLGTLALMAAAWQHRNFLNKIGASRGRHVWSISFVVALFVILIGLLTFYGVLLRHGPF